MRKFSQSIYLDESLLDDIGIDDVTDDNDDFNNGNVVEYKFSFNFVSNILNVKSVFFDTVIEPVLATLAMKGVVRSWTCIKKVDEKFGSSSHSVFIDNFSRYMHHYQYAKKYYKATNTFSVHVVFDSRSFSEDVLGYVSGVLLFSFKSSGIMSESYGVRLGLTRFENGRETDEIRCVYFEDKEWYFYAGKDDMNIDRNECVSFAGGFVRTASSSGLMTAVDDDQSIYIVLFVAWYYNPNNRDNFYMFGRDGRTIASYPASLDVIEYGPKFLDNGLLYVKFDKSSYNFIRNDGTLLSDRNYCECSETFSDGYALVEDSNTDNNMVDAAGNLLCDKWFSHMSEFDGGLSVVNDNGKENVIDTSGKIIFRKWYESIELGIGTSFMIFRVEKKVKGSSLYNYIDMDGNTIMRKWLDYDCESMENGFALIWDKKSDTYNYLKQDGTLLSKQWFEQVRGYPEHGVIAYKYPHMDKWKFMDVNTLKPLFGGEEFDNVHLGVNEDNYSVENYTLHDGDKRRSRSVAMNLISKDGVKAMDGMFEYIQDIGNGMFVARIYETSPTMVVKWGGDVVLENIKDAGCYRCGYARVSRRRKGSESSEYNFIDKDCRLVSDKWFLYTEETLNDGFCIVHYEQFGKLENNVLCSNGKLLLDSCDGILKRVQAVVPDKVVIVEKELKKGRMYNIFDCEGNQLLDKWTNFWIVADKSGIIRVGAGAYVDCSGKIACLI